jgi:hypothetical protein
MEWLFGIVGGIGAFLGLFILFGGDDQWVGIGGDLSWRVGDISTAWMYGLLVGGGLLLLIALGMVVFSWRDSREHDRTQGTALTDLLWHAGIFLAVNAFIWVQDIAIGGGLEYGYWVTIPWGIGLAIHALAYFLGWGRAEMITEKEEEAKELQSH